MSNLVDSSATLLISIQLSVIGLEHVGLTWLQIDNITFTVQRAGYVGGNDWLFSWMKSKWFTLLSFVCFNVPCRLREAFHSQHAFTKLFFQTIQSLYPKCLFVILIVITPQNSHFNSVYRVKKRYKQTWYIHNQILKHHYINNHPQLPSIYNKPSCLWYLTEK